MTLGNWQNNLSIVSDIFMHHDLYDEIDFLEPGFEAKLRYDKDEFVVDFYVFYDELLFSISKSNIYELSVSSVHIIKGEKFCKHCSVYTFQDDKKYFARLQKSRKV